MVRIQHPRIDTSPFLGLVVDPWVNNERGWVVLLLLQQQIHEYALHGGLPWCWELFLALQVHLSNSAIIAQVLKENSSFHSLAPSWQIIPTDIHCFSADDWSKLTQTIILPIHVFVFNETRENRAEHPSNGETTNFLFSLFFYALSLSLLLLPGEACALARQVKSTLFSIHRAASQTNEARS